MTENIELSASEPTVNILSENIFVEFSVELSNQPKLRAMLKDGAIIALETECNLQRKRSLWVNELVFEKLYNSTLGYDQLTREFLLYLPELNAPKRDRKLSRLMQENWQKISIKLNTTEQFVQDANHSYQVNITFTLRHKENPPWLEKTLFFVPDIVAGPENKSLDFDY